ncbi:MAG: uracil-DNA glycosylase [Planctomycetes bacterium]|nr:uracil-DNA glycosylase [Planctomycetota bacterium]
MSPSINTRLQSLNLADQAMGLKSVPAHRAQPAPNLGGEPVRENVQTQAVRAPSDTMSEKPLQTPIPRATSPAPKAAGGIAGSASMQWGLARPLPNSLQERNAALEEIRARHDSTCPLCTTIDTYTQTVPGEGSAVAELFFVGEAPGEQEDLTGRPFVGRAGAKLEEMMKAMGLSREQVFIANVLKSRPPNNRTPTPIEVDQCGPFLLEQLMVIRPKVIVTLGGPATKLILGLEEGITRLRGIWAAWTPPKGVDLQPIPVMPTFHPAYLLRNYTLETRTQVWSDLQKAMTKLAPRPPASKN